MLAYFREERKKFIHAKYMDKAFVQPYCSSPQELYAEIEQAIDSHNIYDLLQCLGECSQMSVDLTDPLPNSVSFPLCAFTTKIRFLSPEF